MVNQMVDLVLRYRRVGNNSTGELLRRVSGEEPTQWGFFTEVTFDVMINALSHLLYSNQDIERVFVERTDRANLTPYMLDQRTVELIRTDPVAAVASMTVTTHAPSQVEHQTKAARVKRVTPPIAAGLATFADAFGESVYLKVRGHEVECPGCGFWSAYTRPEQLDAAAIGDLVTSFVCLKKCRTLQKDSPIVLYVSKAWASVSVEELLKTPLEGFYLPRAWNENGSWVTRLTLETKYLEYLEEKEKALCSISPTNAQLVS